MQVKQVKKNKKKKYTKQDIRNIIIKQSKIIQNQQVEILIQIQEIREEIEKMRGNKRSFK